MSDQKPSITVSGLMTFAETPQHYYHWNILKDRPSSDAMIEGQAFHMAVLEPEEFDTKVYTQIRYPEDCQILSTVPEIKAFLKDKGEKVPSSAKKEDLEKLFMDYRLLKQNDSTLFLKWEIEQQWAHKIKLTEGTYSKILSMRDSVFAHEWVDRFLGSPNAKIEEPLFGEIEGVQIRGRLDWFCFHPQMDRYISIDLKKVTSAKRSIWEKKVYEMKYFIQAWVYSELIRQNYGKDCLYAYVCCEGSSPFITEVYAADDGQLDAGEQLARLKLNQYKRCLEKDDWPGYSDGKVQPCSLPLWAFNQITEEVENVR